MCEEIVEGAQSCLVASTIPLSLACSLSLSLSLSLGSVCVLFPEDSLCLWQTDAGRIQENRAGSRCLCWDQQRLHPASFLARIFLGTARAYPYAETHILATNRYVPFPPFCHPGFPPRDKRNTTTPAPHWTRKIEK
jgi:hypothetical protein